MFKSANNHSNKSSININRLGKIMKLQLTQMKTGQRHLFSTVLLARRIASRKKGLKPKNLPWGRIKQFTMTVWVAFKKSI